MTTQRIMTYFLMLLLGVFLGAFGFYLWERPIDVDIAPRMKIRFQMQWIDQAQFAGLYVAKQKNYYSEEGLDVELIPGGFSTDPISRVEKGDAELGSATGDQVVIRADKKSDIRGIATVYNTSLVCFMSHEKDNINSVHDFIGKTVGVYRGFDSENVLRSLLLLHNIKETDLKIVPAGTIATFEQGDVTVWPSYFINEPISEELKGNKVKCLNPEIFGIKYYSDTIFANKEFLEKNRWAAVAFIKATIRGWQDAINNPSEAIQAMYSQPVTLDKSLTEQSFQALMLKEAIKHLGYPEDKKLLAMDRSRWIDMANNLLAISQINTPADKIVDSTFDFNIAIEAHKALSP